VIKKKSISHDEKTLDVLYGWTEFSVFPLMIVAKLTRILSAVSCESRRRSPMRCGPSRANVLGCCEFLSYAGCDDHTRLKRRRPTNGEITSYEDREKCPDSSQRSVPCDYSNVVSIRRVVEMEIRDTCEVKLKYFFLLSSNTFKREQQRNFSMTSRGAQRAVLRICAPEKRGLILHGESSSEQRLNESST